jgi:ubiquinone/menaquinone biosynthesis C-methylase UbiE
MTGVDISPTFVRYANKAEEEHPLSIRFEVASAANLPFEDAIFDFATAFMSLMDMPETGRILAEVFRVLTALIEMIGHSARRETTFGLPQQRADKLKC